jgi:hypothetical protein
MKPAWLALSLGLLSAAALAADEVDVSTVKFTNLRAPNGATGNWLEADIALNVHPAPGSIGAMVSRVRVALLLGFELPAVAGSERRTEHYRAEAECAALEAGRADVRFYLPPEIVKRDQLHGDPKFWTIDVTAGGRAQSAGHASASGALANPEARKNFQSRAASVSGANDGLLLPQYLTPFAAEYPRATPSFVRRDAR